eukprot:11207349-Lingulodinium_polyedra.AAC.1
MPEAETCAEWMDTRCPTRRAHRKTLVAKRDFRADTEVTIPTGTAGNLAMVGQETNVMATFDGGSRTVHGSKPGAGSAGVWHQTQRQWTELFTMTKTFPCGTTPRAAEKTARAMLEALRHEACPAGSVLCSGDNLAIVRYCAGNGRLTE